MKNKKFLFSTLVALSFAASACQKSPSQLSEGKNYTSLQEAISDSQISCFQSLKKNLLAGRIAFDSSESQRLGVDLNALSQKILVNKFNDTDLNAEIDLTTGNANSLSLDKTNSDLQVTATLAAAADYSKDLVAITLSVTEKNKSGSKVYSQTISVDNQCNRRLGDTSLQVTSYNGNRAILSTRVVHPGSQSGSVQDDVKTFEIPKDGVDVNFLGDLNDVKSLKRWLEANPHKTLYTVTTSGVVDLKIESAGKKSHVDPNTRASRNFDVFNFKIKLAGVELANTESFSSDTTEFSLSISEPGKETWTDLSLEVWNSLNLRAQKEIKNFVIANESLYNLSGLNKVQLSSNQEYEYENLSAYWTIRSAAATNELWKTVREIVSTPSKAPTASARLVFDKAQLTSNKYLKASKLVEVQDPAVQKLIATLKPYVNETRWQMALRVSELVNQLIVYDYNSVDKGQIYPLSTTQVLSRKTGVCQHFANLYAAIARGLGLPTRIITGYLINFSNGKPSAGMHAWNEIEVAPGAWIPVEPQNKNLLIRSGAYMPLMSGAMLEGEPLVGSDIKAVRFRFEYKLLGKFPIQ